MVLGEHDVERNMWTAEKGNEEAGEISVVKIFIIITTR